MFQANGGGPLVAVSYSERTFKPGGETRQLLHSWGDITSQSASFLDDDCKTDHPDDEQNRWKCYDEGHVELYHMEEDVFFFESLNDSVRAGDASSVLWMDTERPVESPLEDQEEEVPLNPGFVWSPDYTLDRRNRVLYTVNSILLKSDHRGMRGFYVPNVDAHTMVKKSSFYHRKPTKGGLSYSFLAC